MSEYVYKVKAKSKMKLRNLGFKTLPKKISYNRHVLYKVVPQPVDGDCVNGLFNRYNNEKWQKTFLTKESIENYKNIGMEFEELYLEDGTKHMILVDTPEVREMFSMWRLEVDYNDDEGLYLSFTIGDGTIPSFYNAEKVLDKYCPNEIKELLEKELIEKEEVQQ